MRINSFFYRIWVFISSVSIRTKILGLVLGLVFLLGIGFTFQVRRSLVTTLSVQLEEESMTIGRDLAARATDLILLNDLVKMQKLLVETQENNPEVRYAFLVDSDGQILAHTFGKGFPKELLESNSVERTGHHYTVILQTNEGYVWDTAVPIFNGLAGTARIGLSDARLRQAVQTLTGQMVMMVIVASALGIAVSIVLIWVLTNPILALVQAAGRIGRGDFSARLTRWANDELGDLADAFNSMTDELERTDEIRREREVLRRQLLERVITTQEEERKRIARELHDSTSQSLTSLMLGIKAISSKLNDPFLITEADKLRTIAAQTLDEIHTISVHLRPRVLDDIGLSAALEKLAAEWQSQYKIPVDLMLPNVTQRLSPEIETTIYRIVQEALTNITRHAVAQSVSVLVERRDGNIIAVIEDDGNGFDVMNKPGDRQLGLVGMRERAELLGGTLTVESSSKTGTGIYVQIPIIERTS